jgi:nucleotide-binding universal stress UspA family protein
MRILIALTGHEIDDDIAATVARMYQPERDQVIAVHVAHPREARATYERVEATDTAARSADLSTMTNDPVIAAPTEGAEQAGERLEAEFGDHVSLLKSKLLADFTVEHELLVDDDAADAIAKAVDEKSVDAIVMGTRSKRSRLASALLGSEAEKVLRRVDVPVTVVKEGSATRASA